MQDNCREQANRAGEKEQLRMGNGELRIRNEKKRQNGECRTQNEELVLQFSVPNSPFPIFN